MRRTDFSEYGIVTLDVCDACGGMWFDKGELDALDESIWSNVEELPCKEASEARGSRKCPTCGKDMKAVSPVDAPEVTLDHCTDCQGFWLDKGELEQMEVVAGREDAEMEKCAVYVNRPEGVSEARWLLMCYKDYYTGKV
jgi:Zn-finger nucleic acid-binding protein